jgi:protein-S-isoprenylcysteine O-methyltransferase Ste14
MSNEPADRPNRLPWPPMLYGGVLVAAFLLQRSQPWQLGLDRAWHIAGGGILFAGLLLDLWALVTLWRGATTVLPNQPATALVTGGPFAVSRNPIYLGNTLALVGAGLLFQWPWLLVLVPAVVVAVQQLAIVREERHLDARFGAAWRAYAGRVRRWL